jgi:hypothetical protein
MDGAGCAGKIDKWQRARGEGAGERVKGGIVVSRCFALIADETHVKVNEDTLVVLYDGISTTSSQQSLLDNLIQTPARPLSFLDPPDTAPFEHPDPLFFPAPPSESKPLN